MVAQKYRWDFVGLSTDVKPTADTSQKVVDGSTYYCSDTSKLYVWCKDNWYERKPLGGGGGGGGSYTAGNGIDITDDTISVDTDTIQPKLTAGSNVTISDNTISATDTTYNAFTGTDGTSAGAAGLVPAPATTDADKFLKADGTWDEVGAGGGGVTELTSADYNYPTDNPTSVALWLLEPGIYSAANGVTIYESASSSFASGGTWIVADEGQDTYGIISMRYLSNSLYYYRVSTVEGTQFSRVKLPDIEQSTGTSTSSVMSQNAVTSMVFADPSTKKKIQIGSNVNASGPSSVAIGGLNSVASGSGSVVLGTQARATAQASVAFAFGAATTQGEFNIGTGDNWATGGYNNSAYRLLSGVYDGQSAHDAATVAQGNTLSTSAPTTATEGVLGQLWTDTTNMHTYQCTAISGDTYTWTQRW